MDPKVESNITEPKKSNKYNSQLSFSGNRLDFRSEI